MRLVELLLLAVALAAVSREPRSKPYTGPDLRRCEFIPAPKTKNYGRWRYRTDERGRID